MTEPASNYVVDTNITDIQAEYAEQIPSAVNAFRVAKEKAGGDGTTVEAETSGKRPSPDMAALQATIEAWTPSGVTADDMVALRDFMVQIVACRYWTYAAMRGGEVYGRYLFGIAPAE